MNKSQKGLVLQYGRKWSRKISEKYAFNDIPAIEGRRNGLYVLYKKKHVIYIGKSKNMPIRLWEHTDDHLKDKWDYYSWFMTRLNYTSDCEALLHRIFHEITDIMVNDVKARFPGLRHSLKQSTALKRLHKLGKSK